MTAGLKRSIFILLTLCFLASCQFDYNGIWGPQPGDSGSDRNSESQHDNRDDEPQKKPLVVTENPQTENADFQQKKPTVVMISIDGFRADYLDRYQPPTLLAWAREGVRADGLVPSFPSLTFPNHVTLVTGRRPGNHGIVGNFFYDEKLKEHYAMTTGDGEDQGYWYRGEPLWTVAEKNQMLAATFFWVGSQSRIGGIDPTYMAHYNGDVENKTRVETVIKWLKLPEVRRPHFISLYFSDVDSMGHKYGPDAEETKNAVLSIDRELAVLKKAIEEMKRPVQVILVSDHGMKNVEKTVDLSSIEILKQFENSGKGAVTYFYSDDSAAIETAYQEIKNLPGEFAVYKGDNLPARWQMNDSDRRGDIVVVGNPGVYIGFELFQSMAVGTSNKATHGWDPVGVPELNGLFIASGSMFKRGQRIRAFDNVHVYPLVLNILGLQSAEYYDGDLRVLKPILKKR
ncbi:MAG: alkaline phosphatase family protein [Pseudobdellovibrionaceae bacterium]